MSGEAYTLEEKNLPPNSRLAVGCCHLLGLEDRALE